MRACIASRCGASLGAWAISGEVGVDDGEGLRARTMREHRGHEAAAVGAAPLRIGVLEVLADVPQPAAPSSASHSACSSTSPSECATTPCVCGTRTPAEHDEVTGAEGMHVEAGADPHAAHGAGCAPRARSTAAASARSSAVVTFRFAGGPLDQQRAARRPTPGPGPHRSGSARRRAPHPGPRTGRVAEHLRGQCAPQPAALLGPQHLRRHRIATRLVGALEGIGVAHGQQPADRCSRTPLSRRSQVLRIRQGRAASCTSTQSAGVGAVLDRAPGRAHRLAALRAAGRW